MKAAASYYLGLMALLRGRRADGIAVLKEAKPLGKQYHSPVFVQSVYRLRVMNLRAGRKKTHGYRKALSDAVEKQRCFRLRGWPRGKTFHEEYGFESDAGFLKAAREAGIDIEKLKTKMVSWCKKDPSVARGSPSSQTHSKGGSLSQPGRNDIAKVNEVFRLRASDIRTCDDRALKYEPDIQGVRVKIRFTLSAAGRVSAIRVVFNSTGSPTLAACIIGKVKTWRFPQPQGGPVTLAKTFTLTKN